MATIKSGASNGAKKIKPFDEQSTNKAKGQQIAKGTLGTLHWADRNTPAWKNRMGTNSKGERLYDFGQDIINKI